MKHSLFTALAAACLLLFSGCTCVDVCNQGKDMVIIQNSGCFFLGFVPLFSGDPDYPNESVYNWFDNTVKLETNIRLLNEEVEKQGASGVRNLASHKDEEKILWFILKRKIYRTSAELVK